MQKYMIQIVEARKVKGVIAHIAINEYGIGGGQLRDYKNEADMIQEDIDEACEPKRVYVIEEDTGVPIYAGWQLIN